MKRKEPYSVSTYILYYFMAALPWLHGQGGFQEGEWFVQGNISKEAHVYLCERMLKCTANIEHAQPFVVLHAPIIRLNFAHINTDFRAELRLRFCLNLLR